MILNAITTYNLVLVVLIFTMGIMLTKIDYSLGRKHQIHYFRMMIIGFMLSFVAQIVCNTFVTHQAQAPVIVIQVASLILFGSVNFAFMCWMNFVATTTQIPWFNTRLWRILVWIPTLCVVVLMATPFYKTVYSIAEDGSFIYGFGANVIFVFELIYQVGALIAAVIGHRYVHSRSERRMQNKLFASLACIWGGFLLSMVYPYAPVYELSVLPGVFLIYAELVSSLMFTDALTGLNNRRKIEDFLENALLQASPETPAQLCMLDLDYFKSINDVLGHQEGDRALQAFADALRRTPSLRATLLGRYGGDEFIAISQGDEDVERFRTRLRENLRQIEKEKNIPYKIPFSISYAVATTKGITAAELYKHADEDLYRDKERNHQALQHFADDLRETLKNR